jgi:arylsulfatase A-like enzyme
MRRFTLLVILCLLAVTSFAAPPAKPNVLWLIAEDFGQHLGCYGTKEVTTPNLDALAAGGARFTRFFTTAPVCSPSRSAFMTGMYQTTIGAHQHRTAPKDKKPLPEGVKVLTDWLRDAGYFTANVREFPAALGIKGTAKTDWNFVYEGKPFDTANWAELKSHQPFYAQVNFQETHRNFHAPAKADPAKVEIPPYYPDHPVVRQDWAEYLDAATELDRKIGLILRQLEADGLAQNTIVAFIGDNGQAHVRGKQFCYDSGLLVPLIIHWPAALHPPADFQPGQVSDRLLCALDLTAQTLDWAGVPRPRAMQGRVFLGSRAEPARTIVFGARDRCDETVFRFRTARDARYRYIRNFTPDRPFLLRNDYKATQYPVWNLLKQLDAEGKLTLPAQKFLTAPTMPPEELYDTVADPYETMNLATSTQPENQAALQRLRAATEKWIEESNDQGRFDDYNYSREWAKGTPVPKAKGNAK